MPPRDRGGESAGGGREGAGRAAAGTDLAGLDGAEAREDDLEVLVLRHRVELAHEEHILGRRQVGVGHVAEHLEHLRAAQGCAPG